MSSSSSDIATALAAAADFIRQGQEHEAQNTSAALNEAIASYDRALAILQSLPLETHQQARRDCGGAWMNRGNALLKHSTPDSLGAAVAAYDQAIALFAALPIADHPTWGNTLGAAWMNRGNALLRQGADALPAAVQSYRRAIAVLEPLATSGERWLRLNLAASWMNLANALLLPAPADPQAARTAARHALSLVAPAETADPVAADIGLKARRALGEAIGRLIVAPETDFAGADQLADETGEVVDSGLSLARHWETQGLRHYREIATRLYHLGAHLYLAHQPHFLIEFLLEHLDPERQPGAQADDAGLHDFVARFIPHALATLRTRPLIGLPPEARQRLQETIAELEESGPTFAALRHQHLRTPPANAESAS